MQGTDGNLYGTTQLGGTQNRGTIFKITPGGALTTLYNFCVQTNCADGAYPTASLVLATDGNFYGTTDLGGTSDGGTIFSITQGGALTTLHSLGGNAGPVSSPIQGTDGNFYGTTYGDNVTNFGTVYSLDMGLGPFVKTVPTSGKVGARVTIVGTKLTGATAVSFNGTPATFKAGTTAIVTTVPTGATSGSVTVTTPTGTLDSNVAFTVLP